MSVKISSLQSRAMCTAILVYYWRDVSVLKRKLWLRSEVNVLPVKRMPAVWIHNLFHLIFDVIHVCMHVIAFTPSLQFDMELFDHWLTDLHNVALHMLASYGIIGDWIYCIHTKYLSRLYIGVELSTINIQECKLERLCRLCIVKCSLWKSNLFCSHMVLFVIMVSYVSYSGVICCITKVRGLYSACISWHL